MFAHHAVRSGTSLVSTVFNEEETIELFLAGLEGQTVHPEEIVVVDGGSHDRTLELLSAWAPSCGCRAVTLSERGAGISRGRNLAVERATHHGIVVTDAGTELQSDWFEKITAPWKDDPGVVVSGFFAPTGRTFREKAIAAVITPLLSEIDPDTFLPSSRSIAFPRAAWEDVRGYPEWLDYCEDLIFDLAIRGTGRAFRFQPEAVANWVGRPTLAAFAKQYYRYARGDGKAGLFARRHAARYVAYAFGAVSWFISPWLVGVGVVGFLAYLAKNVRRVWSRRQLFGGPSVVAALAITPLIVVLGDVAKMVGYPVGLLWRARRRA